MANQLCDPPAEIKELKAEAKDPDSGVAVMELRLYVKDGKIRWVEPIPDDGYKTELLPELRKEPIREVGAVAVSQDSPVCLYWHVYYTRSGGYEKVCLLWA